MLSELIVENYAVVEHAHIRFGVGLNILTGETGSGKSIVVDSLSLLFGARASADMIRTGESKARVSGLFAIKPSPELLGVLSGAGLDLEPGDDLLLEREVTANGKSRAFVGSRLVTTAVLRQIAPALGDIHGQNDQQQLFASDKQRQLLDEYAGTEPLRTQISQVFARWSSLADKLEDLAKNEQEKLRMLDLWTFQRNEIDAVRPLPGEDSQLEAERKILQNVTRLQENAAAAFEALYESQGSATALLRQTAKRIEDLLRIDGTLTETAATVRQAAVLVDEASYALRDYLGNLEADPKRVEDVESRLAALERLKRKYGGTLEEVLVFRADVARRADEVENVTEHRAALGRDLDNAAAEYSKLAVALTAQRSAAAERLSKQVETELRALMMGGTQFRIALRQGLWTAAGVDEVSFLVAPNRGEEPKPLERIASGGELSRIALALKTAAEASGNDREELPLVFDEVDSGVGGAAAAAVGKRLKSLARHNQVICVTHLAQIAGFADQHFAVAKSEKKGRVTTAIETLGHDERAREIGRMLSGERVTPEALKQAEQLIQAGKI